MAACGGLLEKNASLFSIHLAEHISTPTISHTLCIYCTTYSGAISIMSAFGEAQRRNVFYFSSYFSFPFLRLEWNGHGYLEIVGCMEPTTCVFPVAPKERTGV